MKEKDYQLLLVIIILSTAPGSAFFHFLLSNCFQLKPAKNTQANSYKPGQMK